MEQRISIITLGADDLAAMTKFYAEKFGWRIEAQARDIVFFKMNGLLLGIYGRKDLAAFTGRSWEGSGFRPFALAHMVQSETEVRKLHQEFVAKNINIIVEPKVPPFGGCYFLATDIEDNVWEIAWNPLMVLDTGGNVISHNNIDDL